MPSVSPTQFFDQVRRWQWIKHTILIDYLHIWARKVGSRSSRIHVVDAFAGAGTYSGDDGAAVAGSPILEASVAVGYREQFPGRSMSLTCIERNGVNFAKLQAAMEPYRDDVYLRRGDFVRFEDEVLERLGTDPALILLDPIGLKAITADRCQKLLGRLGKTDIFVIVDFGIMHRAGGRLNPDGSARVDIVGARRLTQTLDGFMGTDQWRSIALDPTKTQEERETLYIDLYFEKVLGRRFSYKCAYEVRDGYGGPIQYWLVVASKHIDAMWLMNDSIAKVDRILYEETYEEPDTLPGLGAVYVYQDNVYADLKKAILDRVGKAGGQIRFDQIEQALLLDGEWFGRAKRSECARAIKDLVKAEKLTRPNPRAAAKLEPTEVISLAQVGRQSGGVGRLA